MASLDASTCQLCGSNEDNVLLYGNLMTQGDVTVHYFCLVSSRNFPHFFCLRFAKFLWNWKWWNLLPFYCSYLHRTCINAVKTQRVSVDSSFLTSKMKSNEWNFFTAATAKPRVLTLDVQWARANLLITCRVDDWTMFPWSLSMTSQLIANRTARSSIREEDSSATILAEFVLK